MRSSCRTGLRSGSPVASTRSTTPRSTAGCEGVQVGNAYINRGMTGAIVQRQPFGGWKRSSVGCGPKAGGPDYVAEMVAGRPSAIDPDIAERSYRDAWKQWFSGSHDPTRPGERAQRTSLPTAPWSAGSGRRRTLRKVRWPLRVVLPSSVATRVVVSDVSTESESALTERLNGAGIDVERVRLLTAASDALRATCHRSRHRDRHRTGVGQRPARVAPMGARAGDQPDNAPSRPRRAVSQGCSASAIGVLGGPCTNGHSSSAIRR